MFVMTLGWSRACYVELVRRADTAAFIQCHVNAFEYLGGVPRRCLYDNAKVVTLALGLGPVGTAKPDLDTQPHGEVQHPLVPQRHLVLVPAQVESGVKYVRRNMWPSMRFTDDADLNRQGLEWCDTVANRRIHGTTHRVPGEMLAEERPHLGKLPGRNALAPYLREDRKVARDGFISWEGSRYGVHWKWAGRIVQVGQRQGTVEIWAGDERIAVHPRAQRAGQRFILPGQWAGLPRGMAGHAGKRWRCRSPLVRWSAALWTHTNWPPWEVPGDRPGTGPPVPGKSRTQAGGGGLGQHPGHLRQQAADLSRDAGTAAGRRGGGPKGALSSHDLAVRVRSGKGGRSRIVPVPPTRDDR